MNWYFFYAHIFDRSSPPDLETFPKVVPFAEIGETWDEAQHAAISTLWDRETGILTRASRPEDAPDRFNVVFDSEPDSVRPVYWDDVTGEWLFADE